MAICGVAARRAALAGKEPKRFTSVVQSVALRARSATDGSSLVPAVLTNEPLMLRAQAERGMSSRPVSGPDRTGSLSIPCPI